MAEFIDLFNSPDNTPVFDTPGWGSGSSISARTALKNNGTGAVKLNAYSSSSRVFHNTEATSHYVEAVIGAGFFVLADQKFRLMCRMSDSSSTQAISVSWQSSLSRLQVFNGVSAIGSTGLPLVAGDTLRIEWNSVALSVTVRINSASVYTGTLSATTGLTYTGMSISVTTGPDTDDIIRSFRSDALFASDTTAPLLSGASGAGVSSTSANGSITTNEAGPSWAVFTANITKPTAAQVKAGQNASGNAAQSARTAPLVLGSNPSAYAFTGLTGPGYVHVVQDDQATPANTSLVATSGLVTLPVPDTTDPVLTGAITVTNITQDSFDYSHPLATDNIAVAGYERSLDAGVTWEDEGDTFGTVEGLTLGQLVQLRIRAVDTSGRFSNPPLAAAVQIQFPGVLGSTVLLTTATGTNGPGLLHPVVGAGEGADRFEIIVSRAPTGGTLVVDPDGAAVYTGPASTADIQVRKNGTLVNGPNANLSATITLAFSGVADTTPPVLPGVITLVSKTSTSVTLSCQMGTDNIGVVGHDWSRDGGATRLPGSTTFTFSGLTPATSYTFQVENRDAAGNRCLTPLFRTESTEAAVVLPLLTSPVGNATGQNTATGSVIANKAGTLFHVTTANATELEATVLAGTQQAVGSAGTRSISVTGLLANATLRHHFLLRDALNNRTLVVSSNDFTTSAAPVIAPPVLVGQITEVSKTANSISVSCPAASGATIAAYEWSRDAGANWADGTRDQVFSALAAFTPFLIRVRARAVDGQFSAVLSLTVTTDALASLQQPPVLSGEVNILKLSATGIEVSIASASNNPFNYEWALNGGPWTPSGSTARAFPGLLPSTSYPLSVRSNNIDGVSNTLTRVVTTPPLVLPQTPTAGTARFVGSVDISAPGWTTTGASLHATLSDNSDATYVTSPPLSASTPPCDIGLDQLLAAGSHTVNLRGQRINAATDARLVFLSSLGAVVGSTVWQPLPPTWTAYPLAITLTADAVAYRLEMRA